PSEKESNLAGAAKRAASSMDAPVSQIEGRPHLWAGHELTLPYRFNPQAIDPRLPTPHTMANLYPVISNTSGKSPKLPPPNPQRLRRIRSAGKKRGRIAFDEGRPRKRRRRKVRRPLWDKNSPKSRRRLRSRHETMCVCL